MKLLTKASPFGSWKVLAGPEGCISCIPAVTAIPDSMSEVISPGAIGKSLRSRMPKMCWSHDWARPVGKVTSAAELLPGDPRLPSEFKALGAGCLTVTASLNMQTQDGREAYENLRFFSDDSQFSIGYQVPPGGSSFDSKTGLTTLTALDIFELSPVLWGAARETRLLAVKALAGRSGDDGDRHLLAELLELISERSDWPAVKGLRIA